MGMSDKFTEIDCNHTLLQYHHTRLKRSGNFSLVRIAPPHGFDYVYDLNTVGMYVSPFPDHIYYINPCSVLNISSLHPGSPIRHRTLSYAREDSRLLVPTKHNRRLAAYSIKQARSSSIPHKPQPSPSKCQTSLRRKRTLL